MLSLNSAVAYVKERSLVLFRASTGGQNMAQIYVTFLFMLRACPNIDPTAAFFGSLDFFNA